MVTGAESIAFGCGKDIGENHCFVVLIFQQWLYNLFSLGLSETHMPPLTEELKQGRRLLLIAFAVALFGDLFVILRFAFLMGFIPDSVASISRWLITAALFYAIWRGHNWVRWLVVVLYGAGLLLIIVPMMRSLQPILIFVALQFCITIALLVFPPSVSAFIQYQRQRYKKNT
ncbi:MAG TPA: hypothetical protein VK811_03780 [Candidatus Acidoferrum sp.]|nr:hypothetical protein [Candidatus Acidoferrum sp.]